MQATAEEYARIYRKKINNFTFCQLIWTLCGLLMTSNKTNHKPSQFG